MEWCLVYTKLKQEQQASENLERQGFRCYLPTFCWKDPAQERVAEMVEPLFPRYVFVQFDAGERSWSEDRIRSTKGVNQIVTRANRPVRVDNRWIECLRAKESTLRNRSSHQFVASERVFSRDVAGEPIEAVFLMDDGERRSMALFELLSARDGQQAVTVSRLRVG